ncbi:MAG: tRNA (guanosine(37)-N1)-methyltransferase TrmD [Candidatus Omnitrophota bacterium]|nr:tRNA (guanosine(37)-N1)-methyltransferase TrmD [Candidatus Omnitrophota bacterium]
MRIDIITIFPKMFSPVLDESIIKRAQKKGIIKISVHDLRDYSTDKHKKVDDRPFGGGPGMVMGPKPFFACVKDIKAKAKAKVILLSPQGRLLDQKTCRKLACERRLILLCGHYEGIDERVKKIVDEEVSIGDYVLTGGELAAMVLVDSVVRLVPGVLGHKDSNKSETFEDNLLEYPHYTRPAVFQGIKVPEVLLSGDHEKIAAWRREQAIKITKKKRPDLSRPFGVKIKVT